MRYNWSRFGGYDVTSKGDKRFSAFYATVMGKCIENWYQCDIKGYSSWKEGKGKPPINPKIDLWEEYLNLWKIWAMGHLDLMKDLKQKVSEYDNILSDRFATTEINQAHALSVILNILEEEGLL